MASVSGRRSGRRSPASQVGRDTAGTAAIEFAIVAPILILLLIGIVVYGGYFLIAHSVQQLANDAARAAVAGLTDGERQSLATSSLAAELPSYGFIDPRQVQLTYADQSRVMTVNVAYDGSSNPLWALRGIVPMPPASVVRSAAVQVGGF